MMSPKRRDIISLVFTCLCISKALLIRTLNLFGFSSFFMSRLFMASIH